MYGCSVMVLAILHPRPSACTRMTQVTELLNSKDFEDAIDSLRLLVRGIREEIRIYQQDGVERSRSQPLRNDRDSQCAFAEHVFAGRELYFGEAG
ncbi:hypothetical protein EDD16DRAFT_725909 [Pisolithus croceorrhizus]|nr:hypothetical protein EDD16DRAFT_725909 [Pisolithus croceorrhizus]